MRRDWQIVLLCVGFLFGVVVSANFLFESTSIVLLAITLASILALFLVKAKFGYLLFVVIGLSLGIVRYEYFWQQQLASSASFENQKVNVVGVVDGEPRWDEYRNYVFYLKDVTIEGNKVEGLVRIKTLTGNIQEGQTVKAFGKLKVGQGKAPTYISYAQTKVIKSNQPFMIQAKYQFLNGLSTTLPTSTAAFMSGILIGARSALPKSLTDVLTTLGLTHIVAVSGYNLTILIGFLNRRFVKNWRWGSLVAALWVILGFVIIAGASASIVRAGIMSVLFLLASYYGKRLNLVVCMALVAVTMVALQPQSMLSDVGWQLSFMSLFGIALLAPRLSTILPQKPKFLNDILSVTLAAQLATAGLVVYKFGQISIIAPLSNLLIMPVIPALMLLGFLSAVTGLLLPQYSFMFFGKFVHLVVEYMFDLLTYLSNWSFAAIKITNVSLLAIFIYYLIVALAVVVLRNKNPYLNHSSFLTIENDKLVPENNLTKIQRKEPKVVRT